MEKGMKNQTDPLFQIPGGCLHFDESGNFYIEFYDRVVRMSGEDADDIIDWLLIMRGRDG